MIKGLIFDLDGVITETAELHFKAWKEEVAKIGIDYEESENAKLKGLPRVDTLRAILKAYNRTDISEEKIQEMAVTKNNRYKEMLKTDLHEANILPGIPEFLEDAKQAGLIMSVASSSYNAPEILKKINLIDYFDFIVDPGSLHKGKPDPEIYLKAAEGVNLKPDEVIGFEDAMSGVIGLVAAKMKTVAITWGDEGDWDQADVVLKTTAELNLEELLK